MDRNTYRISYLLLAVMILCGSLLNAQEGLTFRGLIKQGEVAFVNQDVYLKVSIINSFDQISYEEEQVVQSNSLGIVSFIIGEGTITSESVFDNISLVDWENYPIEINVLFKLDENEPYKLLDQRVLNSVVYAYYTPFAEGKEVSIEDLLDIDQTDSLGSGFLLRYSNASWSYFNSGDLISILSGHSENSINSDTATIGIALVNDSIFDYRDSIIFAIQIDSASYTLLAENSFISTYSEYSDTALYADSIAFSLKRTGNYGEIQIGSIDSSSIQFITNANQRLLYSPDGSIKIGNTVINKGFAIDAKNGFLVEYVDDLTAYDSLSYIENSFYWNPIKKSLQIGNADIYTKADSGLYSLAGGYNSIANSYSIVWGENNRATGNNVVVFGKSSGAIKQGLNQYASGVAIGNNCFAYRRCVALGDNAKCIFTGTGGNSSIAIGKDIVSSGSGSTSLGSNITSEAIIGATAIGKHISSGFDYGTFIFADTNETVTSNSGSYEFIVVASGGSVFYTDKDLLNGVELISGSGSWSSVSNKYVKENYLKERSYEAGKLIMDLSIYSWNYKTQNKDIRHIGPLSNDLIDNSLFSLDKIDNYYGLSSGDMDGLILLGIKYADEKLSELSSVKSEEDMGYHIDEEMIKLLKDRLDKLEMNKSDE